MSTVTRSATFTKIGDAWGIRVSGVAPEQGEQVEVSKKDGSTKTVTVNTVEQKGDQWICTISDSAPAPVAAAKSKATFEPTDEQKQALALYLTGKSIAIEAGAGTGKTSSLVLLSEATPDKIIQYVAFNRPIVEESKSKFPANVSCNTAHSLAMHAIGKPFMPRLHSSRRVKSTELAAILRIDPITVKTYTGEDKRLGAPFLASLVMKAVERYCMSADTEITYRHIPKVENLDDPDVHSGSRTNVNRELAEQLVPAVKRAWSDLSKYSGALPFRHSHYLKLWQLSSPKIDADVILFDEAQDASPVMVDIVRQQTHAQVVWVGDSQQEIYAWAGAVNALANVPADDRAFLSQSFRFGNAVAEIANRCLTELRAELRLSGFDKINSTVGPVMNPKAILCRTNAAAIRTVLSYIDDGKRPHLVGGGKEIASFARAARDLQSGRSTDHPELGCFDNWGEVQEYVENDEQGEDLKLMVKIIDEFGVTVILDAIDPARMAKEDVADVVVSTAHKSKGREWDTVQLAGDFKDEMQGEELRLLYVAVTRAKLQLDISLVGWFNDSPSNEGGEAADRMRWDEAVA